jgi:Tfp pilus assembly protein PilW
LSYSVSSWGISTVSGFDYETGPVTENTALSTIGALKSTHSLLSSFIDTRIQISAVGYSPFDNIQTHFATAADSTTRDLTLSDLYPIPSTAASLQQPAQTPVVMTSMQSSRTASGSFSLVPADNVSAVGVSAVDVRKTLSQTTDPSRPRGYDPTMYNTSASRTISRKSLGVTFGAVSGAGLIFAIIYLWKRFNQIYSVKVQAKARLTFLLRMN